MSICLGWDAVRRPASMADAHRSRNGRGGKLFYECVNPTNRFDARKVAAHGARGNTSTVIAPVFQPTQPLHQKISGLLIADVSDDATHESGSCLQYPDCHPQPGGANCELG